MDVRDAIHQKAFGELPFKKSSNFFSGSKEFSCGIERANQGVQQERKDGEKISLQSSRGQQESGQLSFYFFHIEKSHAFIFISLLLSLEFSRSLPDGIRN